MKQLEKKHPLAIRWFHWINFPVLFVMIWSGILIYWANPIYNLHLGSHTFHFFPDRFYKGVKYHGETYAPIEFRLAEGMAWHFFFMWFFALNGLAYVIYTAVSGEWRYLLPNRHTLKEALQVVLHDLHLRRQPLPRRKFNGAQQIAYTGVVLMGFGSLVTGLAIYKPIQFAWLNAWLNGNMWGVTGYNIARFIHFWLTIGYCLFFLVHVTQVIRAGWNNFRAMVTGYEVVEVHAEDESEPPLPSSKLPQRLVPPIVVPSTVVPPSASQPDSPRMAAQGLATHGEETPA